MSILANDVLVKNWSNWSELNTFDYPILNGIVFHGVYESTKTYRYIIVNLRSSNKLNLKISQSNDGIIMNKENIFVIDHNANTNAVILLLDYKYYKTDVSIFEGESDASYTLMTSKLSNDQDINITVKGNMTRALDQDMNGLLNVNINSGNLNVISSMKASYNDILKNVASDEFGKLQTTDTQLISKTETTHSRLTDINTSINANVLKATFDGNTRNVACDDNGVLKNANLTPQTDGVSLYGVFNTNMMALRTDIGGTLQVQDQTMLSSNAVGNGFLENIRDTIIQVTNASLANILTQTTEVKNTIIQTTNAHLTNIKASLILIDKNTKSAFNTTTILDGYTNTTYNEDTFFTTFDMGDGADRYTNITYAGSFTIGEIMILNGVSLIPGIIIEQSHDGFNWFSDGTECSYNRIIERSIDFSGVISDITMFKFIFQKSQISLRYARLKIDKPALFMHLHVTLSK